MSRADELNAQALADAIENQRSNFEARIADLEKQIGSMETQLAAAMNWLQQHAVAGRGTGRTS